MGGKSRKGTRISGALIKRIAEQQKQGTNEPKPVPSKSK